MPERMGRVSARFIRLFGTSSTSDVESSAGTNDTTDEDLSENQTEKDETVNDLDNDMFDADDEDEEDEDEEDEEDLYLIYLTATLGDEMPVGMDRNDPESLLAFRLGRLTNESPASLGTMRSDPPQDRLTIENRIKSLNGTRRTEPLNRTATLSYLQAHRPPDPAKRDEFIAWFVQAFNALSASK